MRPGAQAIVLRPGQGRAIDLGNFEMVVKPAGSFILIPSGVRHGFRVGDAPSRKLNLYAPAEMVGYFDDLSAAMGSGDADPKRLDDIARRHGMEVVGPVPEGYL